MTKTVQVVVGLLLVVVGLPAFAQSSAGEFWPDVNGYFDLSGHWGARAFLGSQKGDESQYRQLHTGVGLGYRWKRISRFHRESLNRDREYVLLFSGGYENLYSTETDDRRNESRLALAVTPTFRPAANVLIRDRNRVEFRWVEGVYSTRYRNEVHVAFDVAAGKYRFEPFIAVEVFYDGSKSSWNQDRYTGGVQWPIKKYLAIETYYLRKHCTTCSLTYANVAGVSVNFYVAKER